KPLQRRASIQCRGRGTDKKQIPVFVLCCQPSDRLLGNRASELPQRQPHRAAPLHLKTNSEAHSHRHSVDRRAKPEDRRSPRSPLHEKKRGTGVSDMETKLYEAQEELKMLRDRLALAEAAKVDAQQALEIAKKQIPSAIPGMKAEEEENLLLQQDSEETSVVTQQAKIEEESVNSACTTDVFQVVAPTEPTNVENDDHSKTGEEATVTEKEEEEAETAVENEKGGKDQMVDKKEEQQRDGVELPNLLDLVELEDATDVGIVMEENVLTKTTAETQTVRTAAAARAKEEELAEKLRSTEEELKQSREKSKLLTEQLQAAVGAKSMLEEEMKRLRVQTEQWRKAAETAAAALAAGDDVGHEEWGSRLTDGDAMGEEGAAGKRKGAGVRVFGDLWKKKGQRK
ncbi:hypothetical protein B296_00030209, partial [Ensete ventricosum]